MSPTLKFLAIILITLVLSAIPRTSKARVTAKTDFNQTNSRTLMRRLNLDDGNSTSCWESLFKLQACTGEIIQFFYNGETYLGPECCHAVHIIVHDCWPAMLNSLGFTPQEGDLLRVYCDAQARLEPGPDSEGVVRVDNEND
ncbi:hypothetical protein RND81_13G051900 [Saponaria officinalis]|uniref:Prolamin-like domain-containing protein n=1 Tax=Saponaria officinalis TaxID=3572 RepID=A0AAW1GUF1_SAPOF